MTGATRPTVTQLYLSRNQKRLMSQAFLRDNELVHKLYKLTWSNWNIDLLHISPCISYSTWFLGPFFHYVSNGYVQPEPNPQKLSNRTCRCWFQQPSRSVPPTPRRHDVTRMASKQRTNGMGPDATGWVQICLATICILKVMVKYGNHRINNPTGIPGRHFQFQIEAP